MQHFHLVIDETQLKIIHNALKAHATFVNSPSSVQSLYNEDECEELNLLVDISDINNTKNPPLSDGTINGWCY
jgi:hypothetical protein